MSVSFFNIKTGEEVALDDDAHIAAFVNSSDLGINATRGQDFKWRIAPELKAKVDEYSEDPLKLQEISVRMGIPMDSISIADVLSQIAFEQGIQERAAIRAANSNPAHAAEYEARLKAAKAVKKNVPVNQVNDDPAKTIPTAKKK